MVHTDTSEMYPILLEYKNINNDTGFFAEYKEIYYSKRGVRILTTYENIKNNFTEVHYYFLETGKIAKFIMNDVKREFIFAKTPLSLKRFLIKENKVMTFSKISSELSKLKKQTTKKSNKFKKTA